ncbi:TPA: HamA C-terminal domain-containing protein [Escherichia coli]|uniref:HamA C-terminal domain-containing protein n=1 Tax=Escherichia coli TaxID=562 RepID=UPI000BE1D0A3|nr:DUF1837 domain-containing protein [Escherichia coli]
MKILNEVNSFVSVNKSDLEACIDVVEHNLCIESVSAGVRFHHLKFDGNGKPMVKALAEKLYEYIIDYCFSMQDRPESLTPQQGLALTKQARALFRHPKVTDDSPDKTGEAGETLLFFLLESIIGAPQLVAKMELKTNSNDEVKGSDGIHIKWNEQDSIVDFYFGEAKLYKQISSAMDSALKSIDDFHTNEMYRHEFGMATKHYKYANMEVKEAVRDLFVSGEPGPNVRINHACLIGFNWNSFKKLDHTSSVSINEQFLKELKRAMPQWVALLDGKFNDFNRKYLRFDVFFIPFPSVVEFRNEFNKALD